MPSSNPTTATVELARWEDDGGPCPPPTIRGRQHHDHCMCGCSRVEGLTGTVIEQLPSDIGTAVAEFHLPSLTGGPPTRQTVAY